MKTLPSVDGIIELSHTALDFFSYKVLLSENITGIFQENKHKNSVLPEEIRTQVSYYQLLYFVNQFISFLQSRTRTPFKLRILGSHSRACPQQKDREITKVNFYRAWDKRTYFSLLVEALCCPRLKFRSIGGRNLLMKNIELFYFFSKRL